MELMTSSIDMPTKYLGFLYIGLMIDSANKIKVLEYNCRMGDPETQNLMLTLENKNIDLLDMILNDPSLIYRI